MTDNLNQDHQGRQPPERAEEMLQVDHTAMFQSLNVVVDESTDGAAQRNNRQRRGRFESRNQAQQVRGQDEQHQHHQERREFPTAMSDDILALPLNEAVQAFENVLQ